MEDIARLFDRLETDIEVEFDATMKTGIYERLICASGGKITRVSGAQRHLIVFHDGGASQGSHLILVDGLYEIRIERLDTATIKKTCTRAGALISEGTRAMGSEDESMTQLHQGRSATFRRYLHRKFSMENLRRYADTEKREWWRLDRWGRDD